MGSSTAGGVASMREDGGLGPVDDAWTHAEMNAFAALAAVGPRLPT